MRKLSVFFSSMAKKKLSILSFLTFLSLLLSSSMAMGEAVVFPDNLSIIEEEAFADSGLSGRIVIPPSIQQIHGRAFANCQITEVVFPEWIDYIAADAFEGCDGLKITTVDGSYAQKWAVSRGLIEIIKDKITNHYAEQEQQISHQLGADTTVSEKEPDDYVSGREFMTMLDWFMERANPQILEAWKKELPKVRKYNGPLTRGEAMVAIVYAAEFAGGEYAVPRDPVFKEDTQGLEWYDNYIVDEDLFGDILHKVCSIYSFWGDDRYLGAYNYLEQYDSLLHGLPILDQADNGSFNLDKPLTADEAETAVTRFLFVDPGKLEKDYADIQTPVKQKIAELRAQKDDAVQNILNTASEYEVGEGGTIYYVSPSGNDSNDGTSPATAWRSLDKVNSGGITNDYMRDNPGFPEFQWANEHPDQAAHFNPGDVVLFERGGEWRGVLRTAPGVTYSAYGSGSKPRILGSPENAGDAQKWSLVAGTSNIWLYHQDILECGGILLDGSTMAQKRPVCWTGEKFVFSENTINNYLYLTRTEYDQLPVLDFGSLNDLEFINAQKDCTTLGLGSKGKLYLRCDAGNPGEIFSSIEFLGGDLNAWNEGLVTLRNNCTFDNFELMYFAGCGIVCNDYGNVRNCAIGWGGGTVDNNDVNFTEDDAGLFFDFGGRYGDGIFSADDYNTVRNNYVYNIWDNGITIEAFSDAYDDSSEDNDPEIVDNLVERKGNLIQGNIIQSCSGGILLADWPAMQDQKATPGFVDNTVDSNMIFDSGCSTWAHIGLKQGYGAISINTPPGGTNDNTISNNILCGTNPDVALLTIWSDGDPTGVTYSNNFYAQPVREKLIEIKRENWSQGDGRVDYIRNSGTKTNPDSPFLSEAEIFELWNQIK